MTHAFAAPSLRYTAPTEWEGVPLPREVRDELQRQAIQSFEAMILASVTPSDVPDTRRLVFHNLKNLTDDRFVQGQIDVAAAVKDHGRHRLEEIILATASLDIREPLALASMQLGVAPERIASNLQQILEAIPSRWVEMKLRHQRRGNPEKGWEGNA